jgi:hypothetical protein
MRYDDDDELWSSFLRLSSSVLSSPFDVIAEVWTSCTVSRMSEQWSFWFMIISHIFLNYGLWERVRILERACFLWFSHSHWP